ncbi:methionyl-tRNA formyltransferase [Hoylesella timonensis]|uniref:Methionyl-tRNA formyltransferase n=1 Tax=Hoylesella timonensis CRIS 5C-B1 TaxID=679189 RepID=D1VWI3_9BACT|nr:methionyl-tRNA formyltransferase [Hoylesella timonensis]EFA98638.1 methionyl-tRNA formyltransferase [Hoylesella timonensis CRIS 5C-B1]
MTKEDLRIIFMGTPEFAVASLQALVQGGYHVVAVVTQPDKPVGRHQQTLQASEVKKYALSQNLPVLQPAKLKDPDFLTQLADYKADLQVVVAFRMLPEVVWSMPRFGTFNVHAALLPQYRGAAPINWAIIYGETKTGVTTFFLDHNIDTGRIIMQKQLPIPEDADVEYVYDKLMVLGAEICLDTIDKLLANDGKIAATPQNQLVQSEHNLLPAPKIFKETCEINWNQSARDIYNFVRGLSPYPAAWTTWNISKDDPTSKQVMIKIYKTQLTGEATTEKPGSINTDQRRIYVATTTEWLEITELQMAGKKRMNAKDFLNGWR